ncbi:hypothetical protein [Pseudoalteromonas sp. DL2-H2.2]|nr:hypothetical protein [Pseudoalteromonas sp. DL2-H2.2]
MKALNNVQMVSGGGSVAENAEIAKDVCDSGVASVSTNGFTCK